MADSVTFEMTKLCRVILVVVEYAHRTCKIEAVYLNVVAFTELMTNAKSKLSNELEHGGIDLRNDVRYIDR